MFRTTVRIGGGDSTSARPPMGIRGAPSRDTAPIPASSRSASASSGFPATSSGGSGPASSRRSNRSDTSSNSKIIEDGTR